MTPKFRAFRNGQMLYNMGYELLLDMEGRSVVQFNDNGWVGRDYSAYANDEIVWMLWTGRTDSQGKLIYEGDIVSLKGERFEIVWSDDDCGFMKRDLVERLSKIGKEPLQVVGNVYEQARVIKW